MSATLLHCSDIRVPRSQDLFACSLFACSDRSVWSRRYFESTEGIAAFPDPPKGEAADAARLTIIRCVGIGYTR